jgi:CubicO group peptidase (beta-lactamase class C family)
MADRLEAASELEAVLSWFVKDRRLAGASAGVVCRDDADWSAGVGYADLASERTANSSTLYRVASITKTFTGTAIMQLRDAGQLDLDEPAAAYIPEIIDAAPPHAKVELVTLRRMLAHASGLASEPPGTDWSIPAYQSLAKQTLSQPGAIATRIPPSQDPKYSNLAYQLLGEIITRVTGTPYPEYIQEKLLLPLGMTSTTFNPIADSLKSHLATGYAPRAFSDELETAPVTPQLWAEGGLWSCVDDLSKWISAQLRAHGRSSSQLQVLPSALLREMHAPRYLDGNDWTQAWGLSWCAMRRGDVIWVQHSGGLPGFSTAICFDPTGQTGAIVLINGSGDALELAIELAAIARRTIRAKPCRIALPTPTPASFRSLLGLYSRAAHSRVVRLEWRDDKLVFIDPQEPRWRPTLLSTEDADVFIVEPGYRESGESVIFHRLPDGRIDSVFLADATWRRLEHVAQLD